jgi:4-amino-4-deoxy-L-arabinose transferase-like glycosyltransferase
MSTNKTLTFPTLPGSRLDDARRSLAALALVLVVAMLVYALPGTLGHSPWKQDEAYSFGIIQHMLESGQLLVPTNAGQPFMEKPPLYYWTATGFAALLGRWLPLYDAARLASAFYVGVAGVFVALFAQTSFRAPSVLSRRVLITVALYAGTIGMVKHAHDLFTDMSLCAGTAIALYGLQRLASSAGGTRRDALWLGLGVGIAALSKGVFIPMVFAATAVLLPLAVRACRSRRYYARLALAGCIALPLAASWPTALYLHSPALFDVWFWQNNVGRFVGYSVPTLGAAANHSRVIEAFLFFAFPAGLLALGYLLRGGWRKLGRAEIALPTLFVAIGLAVLQASATSRHLYLLPFTAPLAVLGARGLLRLPHRFLSGTHRVLPWLFGTVALTVWAVYFASLSQETMQTWLQPLSPWLPLDYIMPVKPLPLLFALALTVAWLHRGRWLSPKLRVATAQQWLFGIVLAWSLPFTLLLPWMDQAKGYGAVYARMEDTMRVDWQSGDCLSSLDLGESEAPLLYYFTGILHQPVATSQQARECRWLLLERKGTPAATPAGWIQVWQGGRDGDNSEFLQLFARLPS